MKNREKNNKTEAERIIEGVSLWLAFLLVSVYLYITPDYFYYTWITKTTSIFFGVLGVIGLSLELNKLNNNDTKLGLDNLGIGLGIGALWLYLNSVNIYPILNVALLFLLLLSIYGILMGLIGMLVNIFSNSSSWRKVVFVKLPILIAQLCAFVLTALQLLEYFNVVS